MIKEKPIALPVPIWNLYQDALVQYDMDKKMKRHDISVAIEGERVRTLEAVVEIFRAKRPLDPNCPPKTTIQDVIDYHEELDKQKI